MGSVFGQEFLRRQRKERKEDRQRVKEKRDGMIDETYHAVCLKKDSFFLPFPAFLFEVTTHSSVQ